MILVFWKILKIEKKKKLGLQNRNKGGLGIIVKITISNITNHIGEVILKAKELRFSRILILSNSRRRADLQVG